MYICDHRWTNKLVSKCHVCMEIPIQTHMIVSDWLLIWMPAFTLNI